VSDLLDTARVVSLPMTSRFRGIDQREALLFRGPQGWSEFSPFVEYGDEEASTWLMAAIDYAWTVDEAERAVHALAEFDLAYVEQPCATAEELGDLRGRIAYMGIPVAADESVRKGVDPLAVARAGSADLLVIKAQPMEGISRALSIVNDAGLPVVVSSALERSVGLAMRAHLAAVVVPLEFDCGLATAPLLATDVKSSPLRAEAGSKFDAWMPTKHC